MVRGLIALTEAKKRQRQRERTNLQVVAQHKSSNTVRNRRVQAQRDPGRSFLFQSPAAPLAPCPLPATRNVRITTSPPVPRRPATPRPSRAAQVNATKRQRVYASLRAGTISLNMLYPYNSLLFGLQMCIVASFRCASFVLGRPRWGDSYTDAINNHHTAPLLQSSQRDPNRQILA